MSKEDQSKIPESGFVRLPTILRHFPVSRSTWYNGVKSGKYPQPVKLSERISAWKASEIRNLLGDAG